MPYLGQIAFPVALDAFCAPYGNKCLPYASLPYSVFHSALLKPTAGLQQQLDPV